MEKPSEKQKGNSVKFKSEIGLGKIKPESGRGTASICYSCSKRQMSEFCSRLNYMTGVLLKIKPTCLFMQKQHERLHLKGSPYTLTLTWCSSLAAKLLHVPAAGQGGVRKESCTRSKRKGSPVCLL